MALFEPPAEFTRQRTTVMAPIDRCVAVATDLDAYPEWADGVTSVEVKPNVDVIAAFYTSATSPLDVDALQAYAQSNLARYKQPRLFIPVDALPVGGNGKLSRRKLRESYKASHDPDD